MGKEGAIPVFSIVIFYSGCNGEGENSAINADNIFGFVLKQGARFD